MSNSPNPETAGAPGGDERSAPENPTEAGKFSISEDWLAVLVGLALLAGALTGVIPEGLIP